MTVVIGSTHTLLMIEIWFGVKKTNSFSYKLNYFESKKHYVISKGNKFRVPFNCSQLFAENLKFIRLTLQVISLTSIAHCPFRYQKYHFVD